MTTRPVAVPIESPAVHGLGWATWRDKGALVVSQDLPPRSARQIVTSAVLVNLLNPELTIFSFAFLPQFLPTNPGQPVRGCWRSTPFLMVMTFVVFALHGVFAAPVRTRRLNRPRIEPVALRLRSVVRRPRRQARPNRPLSRPA